MKKVTENNNVICHYVWPPYLYIFAHVASKIVLLRSSVCVFKSRQEIMKIMCNNRVIERKNENVQIIMYIVVYILFLFSFN
jgi:hypothetical protein